MRLAASLLALLLTTTLAAQAPPPPHPVDPCLLVYCLQPADSFEITYTYTPEYNQTVTVQPDGNVGLMRVGSVHVGGLTASAANARIAKAGERSGLNQPVLAITLRDFIKPFFTVLGEVNKPGKFDLRGTVAVADGLALAGGLNPTAQHHAIVLIHRLNDTVGTAELLSYKALERPRAGNPLRTLQPGDIIVVPQGKLSKIERLVRLSNIGVYYPL